MGKHVGEIHRRLYTSSSHRTSWLTMSMDTCQQHVNRALQILAFPRLHKRDFVAQTNRRSRQESNFHRGNVGNLEIDIGEIRRIVTGSSKSFERENIRRCRRSERGRRRKISENKANLMQEYLLSWRERQQRESGLRGLPDSRSPPQLNFEGGRITIAHEVNEKNALDAVKNHAAVAIALTAVATAIDSHFGKNPDSEIAGRIKRRRITVDLCGKRRGRKRRED
ncbi:hypothetical protein ALC53_06080 [Atta colombica]|uniref:Uncharacterized protein n=1 Tax=Atta colombica TaxID=520822 RepID=A0A195BGP8_9HYME|nr:hypothetical protein ALC53_06080 [Atta colombica]